MPRGHYAKAPATGLENLNIALDYKSVGNFASLMCLVLERFLEIEGYRVPATDPIDGAIKFLEGVKSEENSMKEKGHTALAEISSEAIDSLKDSKAIDEGITLQGFCESAIVSLDKLKNSPDSVPYNQTRKVRDFFLYVERIAKQGRVSVERSPDLYNAT